MAYASAARPDISVRQLSRRLEIVEASINLEELWIERTIRVTEFLQPMQFPGVNLKRLGSRYDGGYVLPGKFLDLAVGAISIGIGSNNDADVELARRGIPVHAWDHTVDSLPRRHRLIEFHRQGVGQGDYSLRPLSEICETSFPGIRDHLILMMDVEGAEWPVIQDACENFVLDLFTVICVELHGLGDVLLGSESIPQILKALTRNFVPIAVHANNMAASWNIGGVTFPDCVEVTLLRKDLIQGCGIPRNCEAALLTPCCPDLPDIDLSWTELVRHANIEGVGLENPNMEVEPSVNEGT